MYAPILMILFSLERACSNPEFTNLQCSSKMVQASRNSNMLLKRSALLYIFEIIFSLVLLQKHSKNFLCMMFHKGTFKKVCYTIFSIFIYLKYKCIIFEIFSEFEYSFFFRKGLF